MPKRPKVLLIGNGLNRSFGGASWMNLLKNISRRDDWDKIGLPYPLKAILATNNDIKSALKNKKDALYGEIGSDKQEEMIRKLLEAGFDHILTTNYSYEFEMVANNTKTISEYKIKKMVNHTPIVTKAEGSYLLCTFNETNSNSIKNKIWHIHGEARKVSSMVLGHYTYGSLLSRVEQHCKKNNSYYYENMNEDIEVEVKSWIDAFIMGEVHVLGFAFDLSEFDLWWLLNKKFNYSSEYSKIYFYDPYNSEDYGKYELLKLFGVEIKDYGFVLPDKISEQATAEEKKRYDYELSKVYSDFYEKAIHEIVMHVNKER